MLVTSSSYTSKAERSVLCVMEVRDTLDGGSQSSPGRDSGNCMMRIVIFGGVAVVYYPLLTTRTGPNAL